jgi:hypothetical protein
LTTPTLPYFSGSVPANAHIVIYFWTSLARSGRQRFRTNKCVLLDVVIWTNRRYGTPGKQLLLAMVTKMVTTTKKKSSRFGLVFS